MTVYLNCSNKKSNSQRSRQEGHGCPIYILHPWINISIGSRCSIKISWITNRGELLLVSLTFTRAPMMLFWDNLELLQRSRAQVGEAVNMSVVHSISWPSWKKKEAIVQGKPPRVLFAVCHKSLRRHVKNVRDSSVVGRDQRGCSRPTCRTLCEAEAKREREASFFPSIYHSIQLHLIMGRECTGAAQAEKLTLSSP